MSPIFLSWANKCVDLDFLILNKLLQLYVHRYPRLSDEQTQAYILGYLCFHLSANRI